MPDITFLGENFAEIQELLRAYLRELVSTRTETLDIRLSKNCDTKMPVVCN